jgi:hypothetical protein
MTKLYNVHIYREMRLMFAGIEADTPDAAAAIARDRLTEDADSIDDCDGQDLGALVDEAGDEEYERSVLIDFACERERKAAADMLAALRAFTEADQLAEECGEWKWENLAHAFALARAAVARAGALPTLAEQPAHRPIVTVSVRGGLVEELDATSPVTVVIEDWDVMDEHTGNTPIRSVHALAGRLSGAKAETLRHLIGNP